MGNLRNLTLGRVGDGKSEERDDVQRFEVVLVNVLVLQRGGIIIQVMIFIDSSSYISITIRATTTDNIIYL